MLKVFCASRLIGEYLLKPGKRRRETTRVHAENLASGHRFGNQPDRQGLICHDTKPARFRIYANPPEPCWWVEVQGGDAKEGYVIRCSRVIVIGRQTRTIHYDNPAGDEGYHRHHCSVDHAAPRIGLTTASLRTEAQYADHSAIKAARLANCEPR